MRETQPRLFDSSPDQRPCFPPATARADPPTSAEAEARHTASGARGKNAEIVLALVRRFPGRTAVELHGAQDRPDGWRCGCGWVGGAVQLATKQWGGVCCPHCGGGQGLVSADGPKRLTRHEISRRLPELRAAGLVHNGEARECSVAGSKMITWWVT